MKALPLTVAVLLIALPVPAGAAPAHSRVEQAIAAERLERGVASVRPARALRRSSARYAARLVRTGGLRHAARLPISRRFRLRGENLALTRGAPSARRVVAAWMRSPGHRALILDRRFRHIGVAGRKRHDGAVVWVAHFGRR